MTLRVAISGSGRIGRMTLRAFEELQREDMEIVLINSPGAIETSAHLYEFDSVHGRSRGTVSHGADWMDVGRGKIHMSRERNPADIPHADHGIDIVLECSGKFNERQRCLAHLDAGAKRVLVSAPCKDADLTAVYGVNHHQIASEMQVISNASCTTNCLAPVAMVMAQSVGIETGYMTTIHAYTGDQPTLDPHYMICAARAAAMSMIPTSTGAAYSLGDVLLRIEGQDERSAIRVPIANVSVIDFGFTSERDTSTDEINALLSNAADGKLNGVLSVNNLPLVSIDFNHDPHSSIADLTQTHVINRWPVRVLAWYDNEWGFSCRMLDNAAEIGKTL